MEKLKYVNLGCGAHFHQSWINIDFVSTGEGVIAHNLTTGIPLPTDSMEVVYHSHVLEHFTKLQAELFIQECFRVLKKNGIIRIAVPDLEGIIKEYIDIIEKLKKDKKNPEIWANYDWILLEMYDQTVRNTTGGDMAKYIFQKEIINTDFVFRRIGKEGESIRNYYLKSQQEQPKNNATIVEETQSKVSLFDKIKFVLQHPKKFFKYKLKYWLFEEELQSIEKNKPYIEIGKFRLGGEIHQWMYDKYSLSRLLAKHGFSLIEEKDAYHSNIPDWNSFGLEVTEGQVRKPDSIFIEAIKS
jgi:predicted SAM-dependent methyltransferase